MNNLFRLQNVSTKRRDRISSDEEERLRQGFECALLFVLQIMVVLFPLAMPKFATTSLMGHPRVS